MNIPQERLTHQLNLQIKGISVPGMEDFLDSQGSRWYREFRLQFSPLDEALDPVSMKLTVRPGNITPYAYQDHKLLYGDQELTFPDTHVYRIPIPLEEDPWHLKGFTFPFRGSKNPYRELRINMKISGYCPGKCFFCHRTHSHRVRFKQSVVSNPENILAAIKQSEGSDVLQKISRVMVISELFGSEQKFIEAIQQTYHVLMSAGFSEEQEFNCCATDVRSLDGMKMLYELVTPKRFSFSLEFFQNREKWMGKYKGIPLKQVYTVLENARKAGFEEIQLNYMAGIDPLEVCDKGFSALSHAGLFDSVGLSTFTIFTDDEAQMRINPAWQTEYYEALVTILNGYHIKAYHPDSYDMGCPYTYFMEKIQ